MVYCAQDASLAMLEVRVHLDLPFELLPSDYVYSAIETGDLAIEKWLQECRTPLLRVPSTVVPLGHYILINPLHLKAREITVSIEYPCVFDPRLWRR